LDLLYAHNSSDFAVVCDAVELYARLDFRPELLLGHVGFMVTVRWDLALVGCCGIVDDFVDGLEVCVC
jgi:hypothetical protein